MRSGIASACIALVDARARPLFSAVRISHMHSSRRRLARVGRRLLPLLLVALPALAAGGSKDPRRVGLERLRGEIARLQARLGRVQQQAQSLGNDLEQTSLQLELQE